MCCLRSALHRALVGCLHQETFIQLDFIDRNLRTRGSIGCLAYSKASSRVHPYITLRNLLLDNLHTVGPDSTSCSNNEHTHAILLQYILLEQYIHKIPAAICVAQTMSDPAKIVIIAYCRGNVPVHCKRNMYWKTITSVRLLSCNTYCSDNISSNNKGGTHYEAST